MQHDIDIQAMYQMVGSLAFLVLFFAGFDVSQLM